MLRQTNLRRERERESTAFSESLLKLERLRYARKVQRADEPWTCVRDAQCSGIK